MAVGFTSNHYVPQWYQRGFLAPNAVDRELFLLDLKPESFRDGNGRLRRRKALRRTGVRRCFAINDLYTEWIDGVASHALEQEFFGHVDPAGKRAVELFADYGHDSASARALHDLLMYMSTQRLRTPKGLAWLEVQGKGRNREDVLEQLQAFRTLFAAVWAECVWQIVDASASPTKLIVSDHPVTVYNRACAPGNPLWCKGAGDPDIRLQGTHTIFPLSRDRLLILTNRLWATNPRRRPLEPRANPKFSRNAMFNFFDIQTGRSLTESEVLLINWILKRRAFRFIAAEKEEWLYPERHARFTWQTPSDQHLLMPDPRSLQPGAEYSIGFEDGSTQSMDSFGRLPSDRQFGHETTSVEEHAGHRRWCRDFEQLFGTARRGATWEDKVQRRRATATNPLRQ